MQMKTVMKYFLRAVKYFIYLSVLIVIIMALLVLIKVVEPDIGSMFRNGYDALWQIAILFAAVSAIYPRIGYVTRDAAMSGSWDETRGEIKKFMENHYYSLEKCTKTGSPSPPPKEESWWKGSERMFCALFQGLKEFPAETVDNRLFKKLEHPYPFPASFRKGIPAYLPPVKVEST